MVVGLRRRTAVTGVRRRNRTDGHSRIRPSGSRSPVADRRAASPPDPRLFPRSAPARSDTPQVCAVPKAVRDSGRRPRMRSDPAPGAGAGSRRSGHRRTGRGQWRPDRSASRRNPPANPPGIGPECDADRGDGSRKGVRTAAAPDPGRGCRVRPDCRSHPAAAVAGSPLTASAGARHLLVDSITGAC